MRRLSRTEYVNTVRDLFRDQTLTPPALVVEPLVLGFENNVDTLGVTGIAGERFMAAAETLAAGATRNLATLLPCAPTVTGPAEAACIQQWLRAFGERAFRRPLADSEVSQLAALHTAARTDGDSLAQAVAVVLQAILQSSAFLYRVELANPPGPDKVARLSPFEVASRLSYAIWSSMPDDALLAAARTGALSTRAELAAQARRMLQDGRARAAVANFSSQWLEIYRLDNLHKDTTLFKDFTPVVADHLQTEMEKLVDDVMWNPMANLGALFSATHSFLNKPLADFYKAAGPTGDTFTRVELDASRRAGILTQAGLMASLASPNHTSPVHRGKFVREQLFCQMLPPPPPGEVIQSPEPNPKLTTRQRFAQHREAPSCRACHSSIDLVGFGFENLDATGRWRSQENGQPIDASGELGGYLKTDIDGAFTGVVDLGRKMAGSEQVKACAVTQWFRFAWGRGEEDADACALAALRDGFKASGYRFPDLLVAMTQTDAFVTRTVESATP